jgi:glycosyltransferase involved in cell wall biosynthesis
MRILMVLERLDPLDGRGRVVIELAGRLAAQGDEVEVICAEVAVSATDMAINQVHCVWTPARLPWSLRTLWFALVSTVAVWWRRRSVDLVHAHGATLAAVDLVTCHGLHRAGAQIASGMPRAAEWGLRPRDLRRLRWLLPVLEAPLRRGRTRVIALTRRMAEELKTFDVATAERIAVIANGVDWGRYAALREARHRRWSEEEAGARGEPMAAAVAAGPVEDARKIQLLFVGHDFKRKGLVLALQVTACWPEAELTVVGGDPNDAHIAAWMSARATALGVSARIRFLGRREILEPIYAAADLLLAPSIYEGFCLAVLEALACGIPVLGSPAALPSELGGDGPALRRVACEVSAAQWCEQAQALMRIAPVQVSSHAERIVSRFTWERCVEETRALYMRSYQARGCSPM